MSKYVCSSCGYAYDHELGVPEQKINPGTPWEDVAHDFQCPSCGFSKDMFEVVVEPIDTANQPDDYGD